MRSLVSVAMPCFESRTTLPRALASLLGQSYDNWELLLVDDGSTDRPREILEEIADPRIRYFRLERNQGRGAARQLALDRARGDFLCMLDADDWLYPRRLEYQLEVMEVEPKVHLVCAGFAVVDRSNRITGVRRLSRRSCYPRIRGPLKSLLSLPVAHAPSMIRMTAAREAGYNAGYRRFEDKEFLLKVLLSRPYCILPRLVYAYRETERLHLPTVLAAHQSALGVFRRYQALFPISFLGAAAALGTKSLGCRIAAGFGLGRQLIARRSRRPSQAETEEFEGARRTVDRIRRARFGSILKDEPKPLRRRAREQARAETVESQNPTCIASTPDTA